MIIFMILFILVAASAAAWWWMARARAVRDGVPAPLVRRRPPTAGTAAATTTPPQTVAATTGELSALEWNTPHGAVSTPVIATDDKRARIRDRYIEARFPGLFRGAADLRQIEYVIKVARHYFEEDRLEDAAELFALAIEEMPAERTLRLAQLEIAYLARDAELFTRLARELHAAMPELPEWSEVVRLGHAIDPGEALFGSGDRAGAAGQYGPWPDMPNWIQASWDLTSEVLGADFHRAIANHPAADDNAAQRRVA